MPHSQWKSSNNFPCFYNRAWSPMVAHDALCGLAPIYLLHLPSVFCHLLSLPVWGFSHSLTFPAVLVALSLCLANFFLPFCLNTTSSGMPSGFWTPILYVLIVPLCLLHNTYHDSIDMVICVVLILFSVDQWKLYEKREPHLPCSSLLSVVLAPSLACSSKPSVNSSWIYKCMCSACCF